MISHLINFKARKNASDPPAGLTEDSLEGLNDRFESMNIDCHGRTALIEGINYRLLNIILLADHLRTMHNEEKLTVRAIDEILDETPLISKSRRDSGLEQSGNLNFKLEVPLPLSKIRLTEWEATFNKEYVRYASQLPEIIHQECPPNIEYMVEDLQRPSTVYSFIPAVIQELRRLVTYETYTLPMQNNVLVILNSIYRNPRLGEESKPAFYIIFKLLISQNRPTKTYYLIFQISILLKRALAHSERCNLQMSNSVVNLLIENDLPLGPTVAVLMALRICNCDRKIAKNFIRLYKRLEKAFERSDNSMENIEIFQAGRELLRQTITKVAKNLRIEWLRKCKYSKVEDLYGEGVSAMLKPFSMGSPHPMRVRRKLTAARVKHMREVTDDQEVLRDRLRLGHLLNPEMRVFDAEDVFEQRTIKRRITFVSNQVNEVETNTSKPVGNKLHKLWHKPDHTYRIIVKHMPIDDMRENSFNQINESLPVFSLL